MKNTGYILGISRGHNAGACLLKDGKVIFSIEEERLSRQKYDGGPYAAMMKVLNYTDKVDAIVISHTQSLKDTCGNVEFIGDNIYTGLARKLGLIDRKCDPQNHPQVIDLSYMHHKIHAACAFYRSGFDEAAAVIIDGSGSQTSAVLNNISTYVWEVESVFNCSYPDNLKTVYKNYGTRDPIPVVFIPNSSSERLGEVGTHHELVSGHAGIVKVYEAVTEYCGFPGIEAGKTMGLFPYGSPNDKIPSLFIKNSKFPLSDRSVIVPAYPQSSIVNYHLYEELTEDKSHDVTTLQNRRDLAYACQKETQQKVLDLIISASKLTGQKNVVISGGYGLNCVANYYYLDQLNQEGITLYVEPMSNDGGTALGAALLYHYTTTRSMEKQNREIYLGFKYDYTAEDIDSLVKKYNGTMKDVTDADIVELLINKNIVALFQGRSENGPRALGNRSLLFDPRFEDGKDFVNQIKKREYFRPFAGSILEEDVHEWFDLRGMKNSPHMMYAVNCKPGIEEKIPSIIHVDGTCRIQTVNENDNPLYYRLIKTFKDKTGTPVLFNTSFNLGGDPLVETLEDALETLKKSQLEYLYLPEHNKLVHVSNWQTV